MKGLGLKGMKMRVTLILVLCLAPFSVANAQDASRNFLFEQPLEGVYSQGWSAVEIGRVIDSRFEVLVIGEGKLGDFFGVLSVDCEIPRLSQWRSTGGYLETGRVPAEVIRGVRNLACDGPQG